MAKKPHREFLEREIKFYLLDVCVAILTLEGLRYPGAIRETFWRVSRVRYQLEWRWHHPHRTTDEPRWVDRIIEREEFYSFPMVPDAIAA